MYLEAFSTHRLLKAATDWLALPAKLVDAFSVLETEIAAENDYAQQ